jgi:zinc/manganese transport system substrate-binding protein
MLIVQQSCATLFRLLILACAALAGIAVSACGLSATSVGQAGSTLQVVAAENVWGSIASQVGGARAHVTSVIVNPDADPHSYDATPGDARQIAQAQYVIVNGVGYDPWASKLLAANPVAGRRVFTVGDLFGKHDGDNPHLWYSPRYVDEVVDRIAGDLAAIDPADAAYFHTQGTRYKTVALAGYHRTIAAIRERHSGTRVGATESIFAYLADPLGLRLLTPYSYLKAISDGADPSAADKAEVENEIAAREINVLVFNSQNSTPDVQSLVDKARARGIPVVPITETLTPAGTTVQAWQTAQLRSLLRALGG